MAKNSLRNLKDQLKTIIPDLKGLPDLSLPENWQERSFFISIKDSALKIVTQGSFPKTGRGEKLLPGGSPPTHPILLLARVSNFCNRFCPCSTRTSNAYTSRFIPSGTQLLATGKTINKNSYILEMYSFNLPAGRDNIAVNSKNFFGIVPEGAIQECPQKQDGGGQ